MFCDKVASTMEDKTHRARELAEAQQLINYWIWGSPTEGLTHTSFHLSSPDSYHELTTLNFILKNVVHPFFNTYSDNT